MREDEEHAECVVRYQADAPGVVDQADRCARCPGPVGVDVVHGAGRDQGGVQMGDDERCEVNAGADLKHAVGIRRQCAPAPGEPRADGDLEQHQADEEGLDQGRSIDRASHLHHGGMNIGAEPTQQMVGEMERDVEQDDRCGDAMRDAPSGDGRSNRN